jgi:hypothetical protein
VVSIVATLILLGVNLVIAGTGDMRRDGRGLDHRTLEAIRLMAVERVKGGERPSSVVASFGFHRTMIYKWIRAASTPGVGLKALYARVLKLVEIGKSALPALSL